MEKLLNSVKPKGYRAHGNAEPSPRNWEGVETNCTTKRSEKGATLRKEKGDDIVRSASKDVGIACNKCGVTQLLSNFYDRNKVCKSCYKKRAGLYQKNEGKRGHLEATRRWYRNHPGAHGYKATDTNREARMRRYWKMRDECPEKIKAQWTVNNMVRSGALERPGSCSRCGNVGRVEAHHSDYSKPRLVVWVCSTCHKQSAWK